MTVDPSSNIILHHVATTPTYGVGRASMHASGGLAPSTGNVICREADGNRRCATISISVVECAFSAIPKRRWIMIEVIRFKKAYQRVRWRDWH